MRILIQKYKKKRRKAQHIRFLENRITLIHSEIVSDVINGNDKLNLYNKAKLLKKYNRRLKILIY
jgi:hypothetical protein